MRLTAAFFDPRLLLAFNEDLRPGQAVRVRFPREGGVCDAPALVLHVWAQSVRLAVEDPAVTLITVPRWTRGGTGCLRWSPNHGVFPETGITELLTPEGRRRLAAVAHA